MSSKFSNVETAAPIEIFAVSRAYKEDPFPQKVDLGIGAYRDDKGKPWVLPVVKKVEKMIEADENKIHEYLGQIGKPEFTTAAVNLLLGQNSPAIKENRVFGVQCLSGTGALKIGADFLKRCAGFDSVLISKPTWGNHNLLLTHTSYSSRSTYRYWDDKNLRLDIEGMLEDLKNAPKGSVIVLHACAHNPTGIDPTKDQWSKIAEVIKEKDHFPFFDSAYQGFASGDLDNDAWAVRYFVEQGFELVCAQSFAKNMGLYDERIGNLTLVFKDSSVIEACRSNIALIVRGMYSNPPHHGARVAATILNDPTLFVEWKENVKTMADRINGVRKMLREKLVQLVTPGKWDHISTQIGMFSFTGLTPVQVQHLVSDHHLYLLKNGRISLCGINSGNVDYVANAFYDVCTKY